MNPKHKRWADREPIVRKYAGILPAEEIAKMLGITRGGLSWSCSKYEISLKVPGRMSEAITKVHGRRKSAKCAQRLAELWRPTSLDIRSITTP